MSKKRRVLTFIAALTLCALTMPISAFAATTFEVGNEEQFKEAAGNVNAAAEGEYIIKLTNDFETGNVMFRSPQDVSVSIVGNEHTVTLKRNNRIVVNPNAQLNLGAADGNDTLIINGGKEQCGPGASLLYIEGTCNMYPGVTIADRKVDNDYGGGVTVQGGTFHMYGGTIDNCGITGGSVCCGGGVAVVYGGLFIMDGGTIERCFATSTYKDKKPYIITSVGGGVYVSGGSSFVMTGGTISNNTANEMGGGVAVVASLEEVSGRLGNFQSSAQILGGTISDNTAHDGAGVLASAYFCTESMGICAPKPGVGTPKTPGLLLKNTTITNNTANQDQGYGAGVYTAIMKSPAKAEILNCTITENSGAIGGGVASFGYFTSLTIDGCTITGNKASNYGGGLAAQLNSREGAGAISEGAGTTITSTKLCNNSAGKAGSDVYLSGSVAKLSAAKDMNELYLGKPDDVTNKKIDGWYLDNKDARYTTQTKDQRREYSNYTNIDSDDEVYLIAAAKPSLVKITFANEDGTTIYSETLYEIGTKADQITAPTPTKPSDDKYDYVFDSWDKEITDATEDVVYKAKFKKVPKNNPGNPDAGKPDAGAPGNNTPGTGGSQTNGGNAKADSAIPPMGDHTATVLGAALTGTGVLALAAAICARKRKRI